MLQTFPEAQNYATRTLNMIPVTIFCMAMGIVLHLAIYIRNECHLQAGFLLKSHLLATSFLWLGYLGFREATFYQATLFSMTAMMSYCLGVCASMILYRLLFHCLNRFPGPVGARISKLWHVWQVLDAKQYLVLEKLRAEYGDFVRTGKHTISIIMLHSCWLICDFPRTQ